MGSLACYQGSGILQNKRIYLSWFGRLCCSWSWSQARGAISWTRRHNMRLRFRHGQSDQNCSFTCWGEVPNIPSPRKATRPSSCWPCAPCSLSSPRRTVRTPLQIEKRQFNLQTYCECFVEGSANFKEAFAVVMNLDRGPIWNDHFPFAISTIPIGKCCPMLSCFDRLPR